MSRQDFSRNRKNGINFRRRKYFLFITVSLSLSFFSFFFGHSSSVIYHVGVESYTLVVHHANMWTKVFVVTWKEKKKGKRFCDVKIFFSLPFKMSLIRFETLLCTKLRLTYTLGLVCEASDFQKLQKIFIYYHGFINSLSCLSVWVEFCN